MIDWSRAACLVTGGAGFSGSFVVEKLRARGAKQVFVPRSKEYDLVDGAAVRRLLADTQARRSSFTSPPGRRHRRQPRQPGPLLLREPDDGRAAHCTSRTRRRAEVRRGRHHLRLPEVLPGSVPRRRHLERLPRRDQRSLRHREEGAQRPVARLPRSSTASIRSCSSRSTSTGRATTSISTPATSSPPCSASSTRPSGAATPRSFSGATARRRASSSTSRTAPRASCSPPRSTTRAIR